MCLFVNVSLTERSTCVSSRVLVLSINYLHQGSIGKYSIGSIGSKSLTLSPPEGPFGPTVFIENCEFFRE